MGQYYNIVVNQNGKITTYDRSVDGEYMFAKLIEHAWWENEFVSTIANLIYKNPARIAWVGDYSENEKVALQHNLYELAWSKGVEKQTIKKNELSLDNLYLVNHTKKLYLNCNQYRNDSTDNQDWCLHPIPLLTAVGNGKGGGDYRGINKKYVGTWCYDLISVEDTPPADYKPVQYKFKIEWS